MTGTVMGPTPETGVPRLEILSIHSEAGLDGEAEFGVHGEHGGVALVVVGDEDFGAEAAAMLDA